MAKKRNYSEITPEILKMTDICVKNNHIPTELYTKYAVNRGLRDINGNGVLTGLTEISEIISKKNINGVPTPCRGELYYRGYDVHTLVNGLIEDGRYGFEEISYLLLLGELPSGNELDEFKRVLSSYRSLPASFTRDIIMKAPSTNIMNSLARSVLTLYSYDNNADDVSLPNVLRQSLQLLATMPMLSIYAYHTYKYFHNGWGSLTIKDPDHPDDERKGEGVYIAGSRFASRTTENIAEQILGLENLLETQRMRAVEYAADNVGLDLAEKDRQILINAMFKSCIQGRKYPFERLGVEGMERSCFYERRLKFLADIAKYMKMI